MPSLTLPSLSTCMAAVFFFRTRFFLGGLSIVLPPSPCGTTDEGPDEVVEGVGVDVKDAIADLAIASERRRKRLDEEKPKEAERPAAA